MVMLAAVAMLTSCGCESVTNQGLGFDKEIFSNEKRDGGSKDMEKKACWVIMEGTLSHL